MHSRADLRHMACMIGNLRVVAGVVWLAIVSLQNPVIMASPGIPLAATPVIATIQLQSQPSAQPTGQPLLQTQSLQEQFREDIYGQDGLEDPVSIIPLPPRWPWIVAAAVPIVLLILSMIHRVLKKRRKPKAIHRTPPDQTAIEALRRLKPLVEKAECRAFSYQASEIIRTYIEGRFAMQARNCTTREFLDAMVKQKDPLLAGQTDILSRFLSFCDLAKYANQTMTPDELNEMYGSAEGFIVATRAPIIAESASENPNAPT